MKNIRIPVYNYSGKDVSIESKKAYSNVLFQISCPECNNINDYEPRTYSLLYVPKQYPHVLFGCQFCNYEGKSFLLEDIEESEAILKKNPDFKGSIFIPYLNVTL